MRDYEPVLYKGGIFFDSFRRDTARKMIDEYGLKKAQLFFTHQHLPGIHEAARIVQRVTDRFYEKYGHKHGRVVAEFQYNGRSERDNVVMLSFFLMEEGR